MSRQRIEIEARDYEALADLVRRHRIHVVRQTARQRPDGRYRVHAFVPAQELPALRGYGYGVDVLEDADAESVKRQAEWIVARAARLPGAPAPGYLDVAEVEAATAEVVHRYPGIARLIDLPYRTWEGRACTALRLTGSSRADCIGIYLLGGVHAREWGSPDILLHFLDVLLGAYAAGAGVTLGAKTFAASTVRSIVEHKQLLVFPQANPDGRHYSMSADPMWRKNRRPAGSGSSPDCVGVDINRNYDFLWNFPDYFDRRAPIGNSTNPCDREVYIGPHPASEPETKNVVWLLDRHPSIRYFVDLHSYGENVLYSWGDDQDQSSDPGMSFLNRQYDGKRGVMNDTAYREYVPAGDFAHMTDLARALSSAIRAVRGREYKSEQAVGLYPTAGASDDYAYSRHLATPHLPKTYGYTIEWGSESNPTPFHPRYGEMKQIMDEVAAGLIEFCACAS